MSTNFALDRRTFLTGLAAGVATTAATQLRLGPSARAGLLDSGEVIFMSGSSNVLNETLIVPAGKKLRFDPEATTKLSLNASSLLVYGTLEMRPATPDVTHTIEILGVNETGVMGGGMGPTGPLDPILKTDPGVWVMDDGKLDVAGSFKRAWTRASGELRAKSTQVTLVDPPTGWKVGDEICITPTSPPSAKSHWERFDTAVITSIKDNSISLSPPLEYDHPAVTIAPGTTYTAEVLNLTRNARLVGQDATHRTHVFVRSTRPQTVSQLEQRYMGPRKPANRREDEKIVGRWALHFHHCMDGSRGSTVDGVVIRDAGAHAFVPHMSNGITFRDCIAFSCMEDTFWWDEGTVTDDTVYDRCVAAKVLQNNSNKYSLAGFKLARGSSLVSPKNVIRNCVATGVEGTSNASGYHWPSSSDEGNWVAENNLVHNGKATGLFTWCTSSTPHVISRAHVYHCKGQGIRSGAYSNGVVFDDCISYGNGSYAIEMKASSKATPRQSHNRSIFDVGGMFTDGIVLSGRLGGTSLVPVCVLDAAIKGYSNKAVVFADQNSQLPCRYDFVRCTNAAGMDLEPSDIAFATPMKPGDEIRVQRRNGSAYKVTSVGSVGIPPFYSE
ncbi:MAG: right-handed parallel beta-helix repeat-containing protein [Actinomycetota bacterium]